MDYRECACCGQKTLDASVKFFDICPLCGWEDDPIQNKKPDLDGGANFICLNEARKAYAEGKDLWAYIKDTKQRSREQKKQEGQAGEHEL